MTDIFIAVQRGVYRHSIVGAASTLERAKELGAEAIAAEPDHYHSIEIVLRTLGANGAEVIVGTLRPRVGAPEWSNDVNGCVVKTCPLLGIDWMEEDE